MKTIKITALAIFATATLSAQDLNMKEVPSNLLTKFQNTYKNTTDVEWEMEGDYYKVEFDVNKNETEIWYTKDGNVVKTETEIQETDLPSAIALVIKSKYSEYKIDGIDVTEMDNNKTYEIEFEKALSKDLKVIFDANGNVLNSK